MNNFLRLFVLGSLAASLAGCGGKSELPPTTKTPAADQDKIRENMQKSFELGKPKGGKPPVSSTP